MLPTISAFFLIIFILTFPAYATYIGPLPGYLYSTANAINDSGQVVGYSSNSSGYNHAFLWTSSGGMADLGTLGGNYSSANAINNLGQVVGFSSNSAGHNHAFFWTSSGGMTDLGTLPWAQTSGALAITNKGQVVGSSTDYYGGHTHAFLWTSSGGMEDLGTLGGSFSWAFAAGKR